MIPMFIIFTILRMFQVCDCQSEESFSIEQITSISKEVIRKYGSVCVYMFKPSDYEEFMRQEQLQTTLKYSLWQNIEVGCTTIADLEREEPNCQPLYIIRYIEEDVREYLSEVIDLQVMSRGRWLLFLDTMMAEFLNGMFIPLDCEFLVVERNEDMFTITEVYSVLDSQHEKHLVANWSQNTGMLWTETSLYKRRSDLHGINIAVSLYPQPPYLYCEKDCTYMNSGFVVDLWRQLQARLNFTTYYKEPYDDGSYGARDENGTWNGVIGMLADNEADVGLNVLDYDPIRLDVVDYFPPLWNLKKTLYIKQPGFDTFHAEELLKPFTPWIWWTILISVVIVIVLLWFTWRTIRKFQNSQRRNAYNLYNTAFQVIGLYLKQSQCITPKPWPCRLVFLTATASAMILLVAYSDTFITHLTVQKFDLPFMDFKGLLQDGTYSVGVREGSTNQDYFQTSRDPVLNEIYDKMIAPGRKNSPRTAKRGLRNICKQKKYGFITSNIIFKGLERKLPCSVVEVPHAYYAKAVSMVMQKGSSYRRLFVYHMHELRRNGILNRLIRQTWPPKLKEILIEPPPTVQMEMVLPVFSLLLVGGIISSFILIVEHAAFRILNNKAKPKICDAPSRFQFVN